MEAQNVLVFEIKKEDRKYRLELPVNAPLGEAYTVAGMFLDKFVSLINEHATKRNEELEKQEEEKVNEI